MNLSKYAIVIGVFVLAAALSFAQNVSAQSTGRSPSSIEQKAKNPLLGRWRSDEATIELRPDGTVTINNEEYTYKVKNSVVIVTGEDGQMMFPYQLDGDTLTVDVEGREVVYTRIKGNGSGKSGLTAGRGEGIARELVGKWCYLSSLTGTNSYMSSRCFILNANGTYEYSSETSSSGAAGGTNSQSYDSGRWSATANSITAYSNSQGKITYSLQKRNHPKTGDPMLVVDGDAYVTAYQRESW